MFKHTMCYVLVILSSNNYYFNVQSEDVKDIPPRIVHDGSNPKILHQNHHYNDKKISKYDLKGRQKEAAWEKSGLFEGDILVDNTTDLNNRNGLVSEAATWSAAIVPYFISPEFGPYERYVIHGAMIDIMDNSCVTFRPYIQTDSDFIVIEGLKPGCYSYIGRQSEGQVLNLNIESCMKHGTVVHELLHALGFLHQQSAGDRDKYVQIHWDNITPDHVSDFQAYRPSEVSDFGVGYDYYSIMHYDPYAFTRNGRPTITPRERGVKIGHKDLMSFKDIAKLNIKYNCQWQSGDH